MVGCVASNAPQGWEMAQTLRCLRRKRLEQIAERLSDDIQKRRLRNDTPVQELSDLCAALLQGLAQTAPDGLEKERLANLAGHARNLISGWEIDSNIT